VTLGEWKEPEGEKFALGTVEEQSHWQEEYQRLVRETVEQERAFNPTEVETDPQTIGMRIPRNDALYKVRGRARYAGNIEMDGMLYGRFVRSQLPHARILSVDISKAEAAPGVKGILTGAEISDDRLLVGPISDDTPILAKEKVRFAGEPIVAIVAETEQQAEDACLLVDIEYEPLDTILTPEQAIAENLITIDPVDGNIITDLHHGQGDIDAGFAEADIILENDYEIEPVDHCFLESPAGVAFIDPDDVLTVLVCTQYPHYHHKQLARVTGRAMNKVRVVQTVVGGAFGGKMDNTVECASALLTMKTGRPIKMVFTREEVFTATTKRHAMKIHQRLGATKDGRITALDVRNLFDGGAYRSYSMICSGRCVIHAGMPYRIPNLKVHHTAVFTNHVPSGAMRSFGVVKVAFAMECQLNELADKLGISPIEIRRINGLVDEDLTSTGQTLTDVGLLKSLDAIEPIYEKRKAELAGQSNGTRRKGLGIACLGYGIGYSGVRNPSTARVRTGSDTSLAMVASESAGIAVDRIRVVSGDSTKTDDSGPTSASRTTYFSGNAAYIAGLDFKAQFEAAVAGKCEVPAAEVRLHEDAVIVRNERMSFEDACQLIGDDIEQIGGYGKFDPDIAVDILTFKGNPYPTYVFATHLVEIETDTELGSVDLVKAWCAHDAGTIVNPTGAEGQVEGGVAMGVGQALWERVVREGGYIMNPHYRDYLLPSAKDVTQEIESIFVENHDRTGPYGAKGLAEVSLIPIPAAMANAVTDAVDVRPNHLPMDSEYVLDLMNGASSIGGRVSS
jgi:CO/xanthine dehydrogenase Mo-binding subunit